MIFFVIAIAVLLFILIKNKIIIDVPSFIHKTLALATGKFGVYCFTGSQGSGKTYALNKYIRKHAKGRKVYSNITLKDFKYTPITSIKQLLSLADEEYCYIIFDEIFTFMDKTSKINSDMIKEFLPQMRKQHNIFLTTAQYWLELPITFRRFVRIQIECSTRPLGALGGVLKEIYYNTTEIKWNNLENEYTSPLIRSKYSKYEKIYMESYDTFERIRVLPLK